MASGWPGQGFVVGGADEAEGALPPTAAGPEGEGVLDQPDQILDRLPVAVYVCGRDGVILCYNRKAAELWGRAPRPGDPGERYCGSHRLHRLDGGPLPHAECPMAEVLRTGVPVHDQEVVVERPDGARVVALVNIEPLRDDRGQVVGAVNCFRDVTERRRAQAELRERERRSRALLQALPAAVYTTDAAGRITFYNDAAADLWGRHPAVGEEGWCGSWRLRWPDGRPMPHDECPMAVALKEDRPIKGAEAAAERPDGTLVPFLAFPVPLHDESGALIGAVNTLVDITERKRTEEILRESEARFGAIVAQVTAGIAETDLTERFVQVNERYCDMVGYTAAELSRMRMQGITHPDDLPRNLDLFGNLVRTGADFVIEKRYLRKDGAVLWVSNSVSGVSGPDGRLTNAVAVSIDITARKQAEEAGLRLAAIVESSDDAIVSKDLDGVIASWNRGAERLFGYRAEEAVGRPIRMLIPQDRQDEEDEILARIRRGERVQHYETIRRRKDGSLVEVSLSISPVRNPAGAIVGAAKIARDITERRRAETQQRLLLREMNHRVKNLFAVASGVVALTARSADTPAEMARAARERLGALARAHDLTLPDLARDERQAAVAAADRATTLHTLLRTIALPFADPAAGGKERVRIEGPDVPVRGGAVANLALLLHEFATNAAKYGALSAPAGRVRVACAVEDGALRLVWRERGGPRVEGEPKEEGFGSLLARATAGSQFGGRMSRRWEAAGLTIDLSIPLDALVR